MFSSALELSFGALLQVVVWIALPLYGAFLALGSFLALKSPTLSLSKSVISESLSSSFYLTQLLVFIEGATVMANYRGQFGPFCQGQLILTQHTSRFSFLTLCLLGVNLIAAISIRPKFFKPSELGFSTWSLAPLLTYFWSILPLSTQLTTSLLLLELIGVGLVWALCSSLNFSNRYSQRVSSATPNLINALLVFVWASGISALGLMAGLGLVTLEGTTVNYVGLEMQINSGKHFLGISEALFSLVLVFKFLIGGGQFVLFAWYRFLPQSGLVFYLLFYYPAHLLVGSTFFLTFFFNPLSLAIAATLPSLVIVSLALLPHLGSQTSPALTLAGSSFVGLSFLVLAMLNLKA